MKDSNPKIATRFDRDPETPGPAVQGFVGREFSVEGRVYEGLLLTPTSVDVWDTPALKALGIEDLAPLLAMCLFQNPDSRNRIGNGFPTALLVAALEE